MLKVFVFPGNSWNEKNYTNWDKIINGQIYKFIIMFAAWVVRDDNKESMVFWSSWSVCSKYAIYYDNLITYVLMYIRVYFSYSLN